MNADLLPPVAVYVISAGRPRNVAPMSRHLRGLAATWVVPLGEGGAYRMAGALRVRNEAGGLAAARNVALEDAFARGAWCLQLDDDLRRVAILGDDGPPTPVPVLAAVEAIVVAMIESGARLGGVAPTANPYFSRRKVADRGFVIGSFMVVAPTPLRFDARLTLKEDWDYTCQHLATYGKVARRDDVLCTFTHYTNAGGAQRYRSHVLEQRITAELLDRWPEYLRPHTRRTHELALTRRPT